VVPFNEPFHGAIASVDASRHLIAIHGAHDVTRKFMVNAQTRFQVQGESELAKLPPGAEVIVKYHQSDEGIMIADKVAATSLWSLLVMELVHLHNTFSGFSALAGGIVLGFMMIPMVMRTTEEVLQLVPQGYREAALALGISKWRTIVQIIIRTALKGIVTGTLLALARVAGETAPLLFTALGNLGWAHRLTEPIDALPLRIFAYAISPYDDWHHQAQAGALLLLLFVLFVNVSVRFLTRDRFQKKA
jgi:ABC-type phosphate transport system permease subunit